MPAVPGGRPARPARRQRAGCPTPGNGEGAHEVTARDHLAPAPAGLPLRQGRAARCHPPRRAGRPRGLSAFPAPGPTTQGCAGRTPAGRGPDLTRRAERSVRRRDPTDGPPPGTVTAPGRPPATPGAGPGTADDPLLTIEEVTAELRVSRAAFYRWRRQGAGPPAVRLPGGGVRVRRSALTGWLRHLEQDTRDRQEQTGGQLRRQVLGHQEDRRQRQRRPVPGPVGRRRPGALQVVQEQNPRRRVPRQSQGRSPRPAAVQPPHRPARRRGRRRETVTWYEHARAYAEAKWAGLAPVSRRSVAEALVTVTVALTGKEKGAPQPRVLRQALFAWALNPATQRATRRARSPSPWAGSPVPRCRSAPWTTRRWCGSRSARAPGPWPASPPPGRRSGASGRCSTTPSATPSNSAAWPLQPGRPHPVDRPRRRPERRPAGRGQPRPGQGPAGRRPGPV